MTKQRIEKIADIVLECAIYGLLFFIPISIAAIEAMFGIAFAAFIVKKSVKPDLSFLKDPVYLILLAFFLFNALSLFNSCIYLAKSLKALFFKWFEFMLLLMIIKESINSQRILRNVLMVILFTAGVQACDGIFQQLTGADFIRGNLLATTGVMTASFKNQNSYSSYLAVVTLIFISLILMPDLTKKDKLCVFFLALLCGTCLLLTRCRGAIFGFFAGLVLFLFLTRNYRITAACVLVFFIAVLLIRPLQDKILSTLLYGGDGERIDLMLTTWRMIQDNPILGKGVGTYMDYFNQYCPRSFMNVTYYAHNSILQIWAEAGIFSLLSFLTFLGYLLMKATKAFNKTRDFVILGVLCGLVAFITHSLFDNHLYALQLRALFWTMTGILCALISMPRPDTQTRK